MADDDPYLIKRYSNRKLYDSVRRKFTTLDEVAKLLESGVRILIKDHDTGADRTDEVLAQVLRRRVQSSPGSSNLLADLLRGSAGTAAAVVDGAAGEVLRAAGVTSQDTARSAASSEPTPEPTPTQTPPQAQPPANDAANEQIERQEAEIRELRDQVSQLTQAVSALIAHQVDAAEKNADTES
ncbi:polyhydroxyalkanoate synthesis regulator DNA-binding domain-containing protein [Gordonia phthalatica]|uniref:polyhydroxyalkanoate synthesis regulator DNA-binding domain-containing protein n=1 Tax=Gordonia phthalatica TaxID=1136941 RepID=UPI000780ADF2|nr:polyhydroxyalkanoate synthesis regulator DNA-binding domain-containing protein [Gordonia phthalatica]